MQEEFQVKHHDDNPSGVQCMYSSCIGRGGDSTQLVKTPDDGEKKLECSSIAMCNLLCTSVKVDGSAR